MKNLISIFTVLLSTLLLSSCTDNDDTLQLGGKMVVNGVEYPLTKGSIKPNYTGDDTVNFDKRKFYIVLSNGEIGMESNSYVYSDEMTQLINFNLLTSVEHQGSVEYTTYSIAGTDMDFSKPYINYSSIYTNIVVENGVPISDDDFSLDNMTNGEVSISHSNGIYNIVFSFSDAENTVSGNYRGRLTELIYHY